MKYLIALSFLLIFFGSYCQKTVEPDTQIAPGILVVKMKKGKEIGKQKNAIYHDIGTVINRAFTNVKVPKGGLKDIYTVSFSTDISIDSKIYELTRDLKDDVEYIEPLYIRNLTYVPSDPFIKNQTYLNQISAFKGWDVKRNADNIIIAITDSGAELLHEDLVESIYLNELEIPENGIDDDGDGYIDNYYGWDFVGSSISNIINAGSPVDWSLWEDNDPNTNGSDHGTHVAGISAASFDNSTGISGVAAGAKLMILKCGEDAGGDYPRSVFRGYEAIKYAADHGAHIINCSWGGSGYSQFEQDIINYATELGSLVIAAASNDGNDQLSYPASYDNVMSVANVDGNDRRNVSSTYNYLVDVSAPGTDLFSTVFANNYDSKTGTSMASPVVAGIAALVKSQNMNFTPKQVEQQVRITSDDISDINFLLPNELGKGRVNLFRALTERSPSVRVSNISFGGSTFQSGDVVNVSLDITNYLEPVSNLRISIQSSNSRVSFIQSSANIGSLGTNETVSLPDVLSFQIEDNAPENTKAILRFEMSDGSNYNDWQAYTIEINKTLVNVANSQIASTFASNARIGYLEPGGGEGLGFTYLGENLLYEMGFIAFNQTNFSSSVRNGGGQINNHFDINEKSFVIEDDSTKMSDIHVRSIFSDTNSDAPLGVRVEKNGYLWNKAGQENFMIVEYEVENQSSSLLEGVFFGIYADWDISDDATNNIAGYIDSINLGYYTTSNPSTYAGVAPLSNNNLNYTVVDNELYDFSEVGVRAAMSSGLSTRIFETSKDVSAYIASGPYSFEPGSKRKIAYFISASGSAEDLAASYSVADELYNTIFAITRPKSQVLDVCFGSDNLVSVDGFTSLKWYDQYEDGNLLLEGPEYLVDSVTSNQIIYVSNVEGAYESVRSPIYLNVIPENNVHYTGDPVLCDSDILSLTASSGDSYLWSTGETTQTIDVIMPGNYAVEVVKEGCISRSDTLSVLQAFTPETPVIDTITDFCIGDMVALSISNPNPNFDYEWSGPFGFRDNGITSMISSFSNGNTGEYSVYAINNSCTSDPYIFQLSPIVAKPSIIVDGNLLSTDISGQSYQWLLGGTEIDAANTATYSPVTSGFYSLRLMKDGCTVISDEVFVLILSETVDGNVKTVVYPNPVKSMLYVKSQKRDLKFSLYDIKGQSVVGVNRLEDFAKGIDLTNLTSGIYTLIIYDDRDKSVFKIIKN